METILLTSRNCHRANKVMNLEHPEKGEFDFSFRANRTDTSMFHSTFTHTASNPVYGTTEIGDYDREMNQWKVTGWSYDINFEDMWNLAVRAFEGTSHSPEVRAAQYIADYERVLIDDLSKLPEAEHETYIEKYRQWVSTLFEKHSRIMSAMIAGPARFPQARNERANNAYDKAVNDFTEWRKKFAKQVECKIEASKSPEEKADEAWEDLKHSITSNAAVCIDIDNGKCGCYRSAFTTSIFGRVERLANNGRTDLVLKALDYIKELQDGHFGLKKPLFTSRHKIWKLREVCEKAIEAKKVREEKDDAEIEFDGGRIVKNYADNRLQIFHDEKPSAETISRLKTNGFRWSRFNGCWQRQLTNNAYYGAARVFYGLEWSQEKQTFIDQLIKTK